MPEDLQKLQEKINRLQQKTVKSPLSRPAESSAEMGIRAGADMLAGVIVGGAIGFAADKFFKTHPLFLIVFLFFGGAAGILNVYRAAQKHK
ncbi:MAG: AtpZ/AtpI family protein [Alphaproteobacteria bacterium]|nr:AtpZ/AtpI family protein [Alphaproteobacteria bacterium]